MSKLKLSSLTLFLACTPQSSTKAVEAKPVVVEAAVTTPAPMSEPPKIEEPAPPPDLLGLTPTAGVDHLRRAQGLVNDANLKGALVEARRAVGAAPDDEEALSLVASLARQAKVPLVAAEAFGRLARIRGDDPTPLVSQARELLKVGDEAGAVIAAREAVMRDDGHAEAKHVLGRGLLSMGELAEAITSFEAALALEPNRGWTLNDLGYAYLLANENEKAVDALEEAIEQLPTVALVHNNLGVALERLGRVDEAKAAFGQAVDLSPKYMKARLNAGRLAKAKLPEVEAE